MESVIFVLASNQPNWVQVTNSKMLSASCGSFISLILKAFALLFGSVPCVHHPVASLWPEQKFIF